MAQELNPMVMDGSVSREGAPRATEKETDAGIKYTVSSTKIPDPEMVIRPARRQFTARYMLEILEALDRCTSAVERGSLMRREGLYSSRITSWRQARCTGTFKSLCQKRERHPTKTPQEAHLDLNSFIN